MGSPVHNVPKLTRDTLGGWTASDFKIDRALGGHVRFGSGIHACLGQMVAWLEAELVLSALVRRIRSFRPTAPAVRRLNNTLLAFASVPVEIEPL